ncbi:hypothetical protein ScPMuIL_016430 [Solemya velum]
MTENEKGRVLLIEPFYGGSHKQLIDILKEHINGCVLHTLPAKKWHWRARTSALYFSQTIPKSDTYRVLLTSSVLNLAELVALRADLAGVRKILYFHENQLVYPVRKQQERDFQYGYNQILSCLVADRIVFNSQYNMDSFLSNVAPYMKLIPDHRPTGLVELIQPKCCVIHFPVSNPFSFTEKNRAQYLNPEQKTIHSSSSTCAISRIPQTGDGCCSESRKLECCGNTTANTCNSSEEQSDSAYSLYAHSQMLALHTQSDLYTLSVPSSDSPSGVIESSSKGEAGRDIVRPSHDCIKLDCKPNTGEEKPIHIVWPHRWEHDKNPDCFLRVMTQLHKENFRFHLSVIGEQYEKNPEIFDISKDVLKDHIIAWGFQHSKDDYYKLLFEADVAVSTAVHEFFGVAMLEAAQSGCYPVCPNRLVYPEIFPKCYLYNTEVQLYKMLRRFCKHPHVARQHIIQVDTKRFTWRNSITVRSKDKTFRVIMSQMTGLWKMVFQQHQEVS